MSLEFIETYSWKNLIPGKGKEKLEYIKKLTHLFFNGQNITKIVNIYLYFFKQITRYIFKKKNFILI